MAASTQMPNDGSRSTLAVIPARGGSTRVPHKNLALVEGHPLLAYAVSAALSSGCFDAVVVSTDNTEYAQVATSYGALVVDRPAELATHNAGLVDVLLHALDDLEDDYTDVCQMMACCPLRSAADIVAHFNHFRNARARFQISVVPYVGTYPEWAMSLSSESVLKAVSGDSFGSSHALGDNFVCPTGAIWFAETAALRAERTFYASDLLGVSMAASNGFDIDTPEDLAHARILAAGLRSMGLLDEPEKQQA